MLPNIQLFNHVTQDTAFVIERFPYAFGQNTQIRYWVETKSAYGQRLMTQVMNPANGQWWKAKTDGYTHVVILEQIVEPANSNCGLVVAHQLNLDKLELNVLNMLATYYEFTPFQKQQIVKALSAKNVYRVPAFKPTTSLDYQLNKMAETKPEAWQKAVRLTDSNGIAIESAHDAHQREKREARLSQPAEQLHVQEERKFLFGEDVTELSEAQIESMREWMTPQ